MKKRISLIVLSVILAVMTVLSTACGQATTDAASSTESVISEETSSEEASSEEASSEEASSEEASSADSSNVTSSDAEAGEDTAKYPIVYSSKATVQGICASEDYLFVSFSQSKNDNKNDYQIRKIDLSTGKIVATSLEKFNHANGMTYNKNTNELVVCALNGNTGSTETKYDDDFSLYVVDADTLFRKETVNLKEAVLSVYDKSCGIGSITYNAEKDEYYALTRFPDRYILIFDSEFNLKDSIYLYSAMDSKGVTGDICYDGTYFYVVYWRSDVDNYRNDVALFDINGTRVATYAIDGATHIESIDIVGDKVYASFINNISKSNQVSEVYLFPRITEDINLK